MPYRLKRTERVSDGIQRIAEEQIDRAVKALQIPREDVAIHQARRRLKMVRAVLRLVRPGMSTSTFDHENGVLREIGRQLSAVRDADVLVGLVSSLAPAHARDAAFRLILSRAAAHRQNVWREFLGAPGRVEAMRGALADARVRIPDWTSDANRTVLLKGFRRSYRGTRRGLDATRRSHDDERWHAWRKRSKDFGYHVRLFESAWSTAFGALRQKCTELSSKLGDDHDLAVIASRLNELVPERSSTRELARIRPLIARRRESLKSEARTIAESLCDEKPRAFVRRVEACWRSWRER